MTEQEYQQEIRALDREARARGNAVIDFLIMQPPIRDARAEVQAFTQWAMEQGALHAASVRERMRRANLAHNHKEQADAENL